MLALNTCIIVSQSRYFIQLAVIEVFIIMFFTVLNFITDEKWAVFFYIPFTKFEWPCVDKTRGNKTQELQLKKAGIFW